MEYIPVGKLCRMNSSLNFAILYNVNFATQRLNQIWEYCPDDDVIH